MILQSMSGVVVEAMASHLKVRTEDGQDHWLSYYLQVSSDTPREVGAQVRVVYLKTMSGCWWKAIPA